MTKCYDIDRTSDELRRLVLDLWAAIENGTIDQEFFALRERVRDMPRGETHE